MPSFSAYDGKRLAEKLDGYIASIVFKDRRSFKNIIWKVLWNMRWLLKMFVKAKVNISMDFISKYLNTFLSSCIPFKLRLGQK